MKHSIDDLKSNIRYDAETGLAYWLTQKSGRCLESPIGHFDNEGYLRVIFDGVRYRLHRILWMIHHGEKIQAGWQIDHINGNRSDNKIKNLRLVDSRLNNSNRNVHRSGKLVGAHYHKASGKWASSIRVNGKPKSLGYYETEIEAHKAYVFARSGNRT